MTDPINPATLPRMFFECKTCTEQGSDQNCCLPGNLRLAPNGEWLCEFCYEDYTDGENPTPHWNSLPKAPALAALLRQAYQAATDAAVAECRRVDAVSEAEARKRGGVPGQEQQFHEWTARSLSAGSIAGRIEADARRAMQETPYADL